MNNIASGPPKRVSLAFAVGLVGLVGMMGSLAWMASSRDWGTMMGNDHMGGMMGGGLDTSGDPSSQGSTTETITIKDFSYSSGNLEVPVGARLTWTNRDSAPHSATANDGSWDTGVLSKGKSASLTFASVGTFDYFCTLHPNMKARLVVQ